MGTGPGIAIAESEPTTQFARRNNPAATSFVTGFRFLTRETAEALR
jgi:hypothetical protein